MNTNPFVLYEFDFDGEMFRKHYGSISNPGVYAIPEDELEPPSPEEELPQQNPTYPVPQTYDQNELEQRLDNQDRIENRLSQIQGVDQPQLNQDEQAAYDKEVEPLKKIFLLNKLSQLADTLKKNFSSDPNLEVILRFGVNLSYKTLQILAANAINHLRDIAKAQEQQEAPTTNAQTTQQQSPQQQEQQLQQPQEAV